MRSCLGRAESALKPLRRRTACDPLRRSRDRVERDVPGIGRDRIVEDLRLPAEADGEKRIAPLAHARERTIIMSLAMADAGAPPVRRDQRDEDDVGSER